MNCPYSKFQRETVKNFHLQQKFILPLGRDHLVLLNLRSGTREANMLEQDWLVTDEGLCIPCETEVQTD
jgi:hypothetical protein